MGSGSKVAKASSSERPSWSSISARTSSAGTAGPVSRQLRNSAATPRRTRRGGAHKLAELEERGAQVFKRVAERRYPVMGIDLAVAGTVGKHRAKPSGDHRSHRRRPPGSFGDGGGGQTPPEQVGRVECHGIGRFQLLG